MPTTGTVLAKNMKIYVGSNAITYAIPAPECVYPRKHAAPVFVCAAPSSPAAEPLSGPIEPTGETIAVEDLQKPKKKTIFGHIGG